MASWLSSAILAAALAIVPAPGNGWGEAEARMRISVNAKVPALEGATALQAAALENGYLDVTIGAFGVQGDGRTDDTEGLRRAFAFAYRHNLVAYLPQRSYRVSGGFSLRQEPFGPQQGSQRKFANMIVGETAGGRRPIIQVADRSLRAGEVLFDFFWSDASGKRDASRHYNALLRGLDIRMGENPTATAVSMDGAQYCALEHLKISGNFDIGIRNLPGSGGGAIEIEIDGGRVGIRQDGFRPNPTLVGFTAVNQREGAIQLSLARGPLVVSDFDISAGPDSAAGYVGVRALQTRFRDPGAASLLLSHGRIRVPSGAAAVKAEDRGVLLEHVTTGGGAILIRGEAADPEGAVAFHERLAASLVFTSKADEQAKRASGAERATRKSYADLFTAGTPVAEPGRHVSILRFGATPDRVGFDNSAAFAAAFQAVTTQGSPDFGKAVFVPRGHFTVWSPVKVPDGVRLMGASSTISVIQAGLNWKPVGNTALMSLEQGSKGIFVHDLALLGHDPSISKGTSVQSQLGLLDVANSAVRWRDVQFARTEFWKDDLSFDAPTFRFRPTAGGYFFAFASDMSHRTMAGGRVGPDHRHLLIESRSKPLVFHALNIEHGASDPEIEIRDASNVRILGFKFENDLIRQGRFGDPAFDGSRPLLHIERSQDIAILGGSGNMTLGFAASIIQIKNSRRVMLGLLDRQPDARNARDQADGAAFSFVTVDGRSLDKGQDVGLITLP